MRIGREGFPSELQCRDGLFLRYGRERTQKILQRVASLQVIEENLYGYASSAENWCPSKASRPCLSPLLSPQSCFFPEPRAWR